MPNLHLTYFNIEGLGEPTRLACAMSGVAFEDVRVQFSEWEALKPTTKFGQLPTMKVDDLGMEVAQSGAMLRYVARYYSTSLLPADAAAYLKVEEAASLVDDFNAAWAPALLIGMRPEKIGYPEGYNKTEEGAAKVQELRGKFVDTTLPQFAKYFTDFIEENGGAFLAGATPTIADCMLLPALRKFTKGFIDHVPKDCLEKFPAIVAYISRMLALPAVAAWYENPTVADTAGPAATPAKDTPMAVPEGLKLTYFNIQGLAEQVRLACAVTGTEFEDVRVKFEDWPAMKPNTKYGQLPILNVDGKEVAQSWAMLRWLGRFANGQPSSGPLVPAEPAAYLKVEEALGFVNDFQTAWAPCLYIGMMPGKYGRPEDFAKTDEGQALIKKMREAWVADTLPQFAKWMSEMIDANGGFIAAGHLTVADLALLPMLARYQAGYIDHVPKDCLDAYPTITAYLARVRAVPEIAQWYSK
eukprot:TRINITY_DN4214_c0_g1_i1.p1 TRINITY_DN4214_c0_g1~~TRINITY_DN4214_c0_g1_i1.p1  ORF type:complete len:497 (+),score=205.89 TRINITY_DN4214_c0_g1_i1:82-1491(+)